MTQPLVQAAVIAISNPSSLVENLRKVRTPRITTKMTILRKAFVNAEVSASQRFQCRQMLQVLMVLLKQPAVGGRVLCADEDLRARSLIGLAIHVARVVEHI